MLIAFELEIVLSYVNLACATLKKYVGKDFLSVDGLCIACIGLLLHYWNG